MYPLDLQGSSNTNVNPAATSFSRRFRGMQNQSVGHWNVNLEPSSKLILSHANAKSAACSNSKVYDRCISLMDASVYWLLSFASAAHHGPLARIAPANAPAFDQLPIRHARRLTTAGG